MMEGHRRGSPNYLMSLNDTLTCGFGASLLLFFVFAVLVVFDEPGKSDGEVGLLAQASGRALRPEELSGDAQLYVRIASTHPELINAIVVPRKDKWLWEAQPILGRPLTETSLLVLHWKGQIPLQRLEFNVEKPLAGEKRPAGKVYVTVMLGGTLLTTAIGVFHEHKSDSDELFTVHLGGFPLVSFPAH